jgi:hypothetical protein
MEIWRPMELSLAPLLCMVITACCDISRRELDIVVKSNFQRSAFWSFKVGWAGLVVIA